MPSAEFETAYKTKFAKSPSNDEMLQMYALAKVAKQEDISKASKPGMFDLAGKAKQSAWQKEVDAGTSPADAEKKYVELVKKLKEKYGEQ